MADLPSTTPNPYSPVQPNHGFATPPPAGAPTDRVQVYLHATFIIAGLATVAAGVIGGSFLHFVFAGIAGVAGALSRRRSRIMQQTPSPAATVAVGCAAAWVIGVIVLAVTYGALMADFH